jgi:prepilin-type N-terminal cleavage/methylation domain-containing protein
MMIRSSPIHSRRGFTLIELLVVITVIAILASMVMPAIGFVKELANKAKCGKNLNGIFAALTAYQEGGDSGWPDARWKAGLTGGNGTSATTNIQSGDPAAQYTVAIFEILAASQTDSMPVSLFRCPSQTAPAFGPDISVRPSLSRAGTAWGWGINKIPYAMDWSAPSDAGAVRALLADRDVINHKDKESVVCYADGHYKRTARLKSGGSGANQWMAAKGTNKTMGLDGPLDQVVVENQEARGAEGMGDDNNDIDNIYDDDGDVPKSSSSQGSRTLTPGAGGGRRAYMK